MTSLGYDAAGNVVTSTDAASRTTTFIDDTLNRLTAAVNTANGQVVQRLDYDAFGQVLLDTSPGFQPFGFAGGLYDPQIGLVRFGARDYDPQTGRWTMADPIRFAGRAPNLYGYAMNDPVNLTDRFGLSQEDILEVYQWIVERHPEVTLGTNPSFFEVDLPSDILGAALPFDAILIDPGYESKDALVDTVAHELMHTQKGFVGNLIEDLRTRGQSHLEIYLRAEQLRRDYLNWLEEHTKDEDCQ